MSDIRMHITVTGSVQGVGYRYFALARARHRNLTGWVRNLDDGRVEAEAQGDEVDVRGFVEDLRSGPPMSHVRDLRSVEVPCQSHEHLFEITH